ncbi:hypothetical protein JOQ06_018755, partial [Pogonophryne albipinna]
ELDKAWKMVDAAHAKESKDKETIRTLKEDVSNLMQTAEQQTNISLDQEQSDLLKINEELNVERDELLTTVEALRGKLNKAITVEQEMEARREQASENISQLQQELQVQQNEISREMRLKEKLDKEVKQLQVDMEAKLGEIKALNVQGQRAKEEQQRLEQQLRELKMLNERSSKDLEQMQLKNNKLLQDSEQLSAAKQHLSLENQQNANELKIREDEVNQMRQEMAKQTKMRETIQKKFHQMEDQKSDVEVQRETLRAQIAALEKDLESSQKQVESDRKAIDELVRERDILNKNMIKAALSTEKQQSLVKLLEQDKKTLEHEISGFRLEAQKQRKIIQQLEKERDRNINETSSLMQKVQQKVDDVEVREMEIFDWRKKVTEAECKLKQQENLLESVVSERNLYSKNLIEAQVTRLRDEITGKELALTEDQQEHKRLEKDNETLKGELQLMKLQLEETKQRVDSQKAEQLKLQKIIANADAEQIQQKKQLEQVIRERDNLVKQLLHRNDERALLYEKIRIQQSILSKGDFHYNQRMDDVRLLRVEIKRLRRELFHLQRELLRERTRNSVLEDQLRPINIHRWRRLEGSDPGRYELIQKIQSLQKRLIAKTQELEEHELLLQEKEKLYVELKHILARQPGPEAAEQLQQCQWILRERTKKLKERQSSLGKLPSVHDHFTNAANDTSRDSRDRAKYKGLDDVLTSATFVSNLGLMYDALTELSDLSRQLQKREMTLPTADRLLTREIRVFESMVTMPGPHMTTVHTALAEKSFKGVALRENGRLVQIHAGQFFRSMVENLRHRMTSTTSSHVSTREIPLHGREARDNQLIQDMKVIHPGSWPEEELDVQYGDVEALIAELRMVDSKMNEYKSENQRLANEMANIKKKYLSQKMLHSEQRGRSKVEQPEPLPQLSTKAHFTGGGFRIDVPVRR